MNKKISRSVIVNALELAVVFALVGLSALVVEFVMISNVIAKGNEKELKEKGFLCITQSELTVMQDCVSGVVDSALEGRKVSTMVKEENEKAKLEEEAGFEFLEEIPLEEDLQKFIWDECENNKAPVFLVYAMIEQESGFNAEAVGIDGKDVGLMQIREVNHESLREKIGCDLDFSNAFDNAKAGIYMIGNLLKDNEGNIVNALMCYNMGPTGAKRAWEKGITETQYTKQITENMEKWESVYNER